MANQTISFNENLYNYFQQHAYREEDLLKELREETATLPEAVMQISPEQGAFMSMMVKLIGCENIIEIGTFTGYSSLCMSRSLPENGQLIALDISEEWTSVAQKYWQKAKVDHLIELRLGSATDSLNEMIEDQKQETIDLIFIDADKEAYLNYFESGMKLLKTGGAMLFDNVLWGGAVADESDQSSSTVAIRKLNDVLIKDQRVDICMTPIGDGLTIIRKR
ncbi:MAG: class I SAM-dependent methyltransferase [Gammaproteobacteria bacterium]